MKALQVYLAVEPVENFHEPAHVGALELMGQVHVHVHPRDRVLQGLVLVHYHDRVGNILDPDFLDVDTPVIAQALDVLHCGMLPPELRTDICGRRFSIRPDWMI